MARIALGVAGAVVGGIYGGAQGAQIGWMIGSTIGGVVDPMQIEGPALGDQPVQTSRDGVARPIIFGTAPATGNMIFRSPPKFTKKKTKQPKGGPISVENRVLYSYAIRICCGRTKPVTGVTRIWEDEKLVYDVRPVSTMVAESAKWLSNKKIYLGTETQLPDPTYELYKGVGTTPALRGTCYMMVTDEDRTEYGGRIPSYRFEVTTAGSSAPPEVVDMDEYFQAGIAGGISGSTLRIYRAYTDSKSFMKFFATNSPTAELSGPTRVRVFAESRMVWDSGWMGDVADQADLNAELLSVTQIQYEDYQVLDSQTYVTDPAQVRAIVLDIDDGAITGSSTSEGYYIPNSLIGGLTIELIRPDSNNHGSVNVQFIAFEPDVSEEYIAYRSQPGVLRGLDTGTTYFTEFAEQVGIVTPGATNVRDVIETLSAKVGVSPLELEIDQVGDEEVLGYPVAGLFACAQALKPLQNAHFFDFATYDLKTWAVKRGKAAVLDLYDEECLEGSDVDQTDDVQTFPLKLHLSYQDPDVGYAITTANVSRSSQDVRVVGEVSPAIPECMNSEKAHQVADVMLKIAWVDARGEVRRKTTRRHSKLVPTNSINLISGGRVRRLRIVDIDRVDGVNELIMHHDRQSAYTSDLDGVVLPVPTPPPSTIAGPTFFAAFNAPPRSDLEDQLGYYVSGAGVLSGWAGYQLDRSVDSGVTYELEDTYSYEATSGQLTQSLAAASPHYLDDTNELYVSLYAGEFESITTNQLFNYGNALAIQRPDGTVEYVQFRDAELVSTNLWKLTNLLRGRRGTSSEAHLAGAAVTLVSDLAFVPIASALIGRTVTHRPTSFTEHPDDSVEYDLNLSTVHSQRDLAPLHLSASLDGSNLNVSWVARWFLGTSMNPVPSSNFANWEIQVSGTGGTVTALAARDVRSAIVDVSSLSGTLTVTVAGVNRLTGKGAQALETI